MTGARPGARPGPDLEIVAVPLSESFKVWAHGYPFRTVKWHFHPEYELHLITATHGRVSVGDYAGPFAPGNLVLTGPNLPHNWISDVAPGAVIAERCLVLQFGAAFAQTCARDFPELASLVDLLEEAARGVQFGGETGRSAEPLLRRLLTEQGPARLALFFELVALLGRTGERRPLASVGYRPDAAAYMRRPLNHVLEHIERNLGTALWECDLAALSGYTPTAFSRAFVRQTGMTFVTYVNTLRINRACELLATTELRVADICYEVGFNNLSNFNRQFLAHKAMPPRAFRGLRRGDARSVRIVDAGRAAPSNHATQRSSP